MMQCLRDQEIKSYHQMVFHALLQLAKGKVFVQVKWLVRLELNAVFL